MVRKIESVDVRNNPAIVSLFLQIVGVWSILMPKCRFFWPITQKMGIGSGKACTFAGILRLVGRYA
ncbi:MULTISPECIES: hypothetical protein [Cohnella]|uniref:hypothetical protein n=1 Tax=Cohnella TaxID=329857 RepID=UPI001119FF4D|nr:MULTISPECIES: hypothetical protein [Cohnella]MBN2984624.1 hypothetical protein [Cohnella algarum]